MTATTRKGAPHPPCLFLALCLGLLSLSAPACETDPEVLSSPPPAPTLTFGFHYGILLEPNLTDVRETGFSLRYGLPHALPLPGNLRLTPAIAAEGGWITDDEHDGGYSSLGPSVALGRPAGRWRLILTSMPTYLSTDRLDKKNLGGHFHFTSSLGIQAWITKRIGIGYKVQHRSNARVDEPNPGLDMQVLEVVYRL